MKSKKGLAFLGVAAVALVGGTFAYFTQTDSIDNQFDTAKYGTVVVEDFKPKEGENWQPGAEINKDIYVTNTGSRNVVVRVKFEDMWSRSKDGKEVLDKTLNSTDTMTVWQEDQYDGETDKDKSVVHKKFSDESKGKWSELQPDGYYYYLFSLEPEKETGIFLDSVTLDKDTDMGMVRTQFYYTEEEEMPEVNPDNMSLLWKPLGDLQMPGAAMATPPNASTFTTAVTKPVAGEDGKQEKLGYSDAGYVLRITIESVQATDKAVEQIFGDNYDKTIVEGWGLEPESLKNEESSESPKEPGVGGNEEPGETGGDGNEGPEETTGAGNEGPGETTGAGNEGPEETTGTGNEGPGETIAAGN